MGARAEGPAGQETLAVFMHPLAQRVMVFNFGAKIAEGTPQEVRRHPAVMEAYRERFTLLMDLSDLYFSLATSSAASARPSP